MSKGIHRTITEKAFFVIFFVLFSAIGVSKLVLGMDTDEILEKIITTVISTIVAMITVSLIFFVEGRKRGKG